MKFDSKDKIDPKNLAKNLRAALKESGGQPTDLVYLHSRVDKKSNAKKPPLLMIGEVTTGLLAELRGEEKLVVVEGKLAETADTILFQAAGGVLTEKVLTVQLMDAGIRKKTRLVDDVAQALQPAQNPTGGATAAQGGEDPLLKAAKQKWPSVESRMTQALKTANDNYKTRLQESAKDARRLIEAGQGKEAARQILAIEKMLDDLDRPQTSEDMAKQAPRNRMADRAVQLKKRMEGFKNPPLHDKHLKEIADTLKLVATRIAESTTQNKPLDVVPLGRLMDGADKILDRADELAEIFRDGLDDLEALAEELDKFKDEREVIAKNPRLSKALKAEEQKDEDAQKKRPRALLDADRYAPFEAATSARRKLIEFIRENMPKESVDTEPDPVKRRKKKFMHDDPRTWEINAILYENGTSESAIGSKVADLLKKGQLSSNTTAGGKVLKANFRGHVHLDSGSGGMAFIYKRNDDYTVTPVVVDTSSKRGGKNGNQYSWNTGGTWDYFPPNAGY